MVNDNPFNDLLHRVENYDIELLEYVAGKKESGAQRGWEGNVEYVTEYNKNSTFFFFN